MRLGLERIEALLAALGHPEAGLRILHVGGTNGKGSVAALSAAILQAAGLRTGLYTSPHLLDVTERVRIEGVAVPREVLARHAARIEPALEAGAATFFEAMTAVALATFRDAAVDAAVLEVGLGGRWDATNVGSPLVSVVTRIDYDHQEFLGRRLEDIAGEKAGIIRGGTALSAAQAPEAMAVVQARCRAVGVPLLVEGRELTVEALASDLEGHWLRLSGPDGATTTSASHCLDSFSPETPSSPSAPSGPSRMPQASRCPRPRYGRGVRRSGGRGASRSFRASRGGRPSFSTARTIRGARRPWLRRSGTTSPGDGWRWSWVSRLTRTVPGS